jgi:ABC-type proline/glycine betaine transport system permease subunit
MLKQMMHDCRGPDGKPDFDKMIAFMEEHDRSGIFDVIGWALFFVWVGIAWLLGLSLGWGLLGVGLLTVGIQLLRYWFGVSVEKFWVVVGVALLVAAIWELWSIAIPLAPLVLIAVGIGLLVSYFASVLRGKKRLF